MISSGVHVVHRSTMLEDLNGRCVKVEQLDENDQVLGDCDRAVPVVSKQIHPKGSHALVVRPHHIVALPEDRGFQEVGACNNLHRRAAQLFECDPGNTSRQALSS